GAGRDLARHRGLPRRHRPVHRLGPGGEPHHGVHRAAGARPRLRGGRQVSNFDFSFYNWALIQDFVLKGFVFSVQLTLIAMIGGILLGTVLALMRLSGIKWLAVPATIYVNGLRSIPLVMVILWFYLLIPFVTGKAIGKELSAIIT